MIDMRTKLIRRVYPREGNKSMVHLLLTRNALVDGGDAGMWSPLLWAAYTGCPHQQQHHRHHHRYHHHNRYHHRHQHININIFNINTNINIINLNSCSIDNLAVAELLVAAGAEV